MERIIMQTRTLLMFLTVWALALLCANAAAAGDDGVWAFDFGAKTPHLGWKRVEDGFIPVKGDPYDRGKGYGWDKQVVAMICCGT